MIGFAGMRKYTQDIVASGKKRALILPGRLASEQAGIRHCTEWLKSVITELSIEFIPAAEPFRRPDAPAS